MIDNLKCRDCPYGKEDFERRLYNYNKTIKEHGIPNDIYGYLQHEDAPDEFERFLWCDKVGGKVYCFGRCSDYYIKSDISKTKKTSKQKKRNKENEIRNIRIILKDYQKLLADSLLVLLIQMRYG